MQKQRHANRVTEMVIVIIEHAAGRIHLAL
jgi:hypothetical protein